jgi:aldehyde:ferredoxin oxidoreductase
LLRETPQTAEVFPKLGTLANVERCSEIGCLPTRNFSAGTFEGASRLGGRPIRELILARGGEGTPTHTCMPGCLIRCSNKYPGADGKTIVAPLEYETLALMGSNLGIDDPDVVAEFNYICNDLGLDTIETGGAIGVCMEAGLAGFGDSEGARRLLQEEAQGTVLGRLLGEGVAVTGRVLGVRRVPAVKGQGLPGYDPRALKGLGVTLAVSPQGADHTAGQTIRSAVDPHGVEGQVEASRRSQEQSAWYDSLGLCMFAGAALGGRPELIADLLSSATGEEWTVEQLWELGRDVLAMEREFNAREGFTAADDRLPQFFYDEPLGPKGLKFDVPLNEV